MDIAIFVFDTNARATSTVIAVMVPEALTAIPIPAISVTTIPVAVFAITFPEVPSPFVISSSIPISTFAVAVAHAAITHAFVISLALLRLLADLRGLLSRGLGEACGYAA
jgi:hypothetical protein